MNKHKNSKHRRLKLEKETVVHLTDGLLKQVIGGSDTIEDPTLSFPISRCCVP